VVADRLGAIAFGVFALAAMLPGAVAAKAVPPGRYECWFYTTPQHLKDFTLNGSTYIDASGVSGSVTISGNELTFRGGNLDGRTGIYRRESAHHQLLQRRWRGGASVPARLVEQTSATTMKAKPCS
jgi:hypothetical protein